jgi:hypothetical protein
VAKLRPLTDSKHFGKDAFEIDLLANEGQGSVRCPAGVMTSDFRMASDGKYRPVKLFRFPREACEGCELRERCLGGPSGRAKRPVRTPPGRVRCSFTTMRECSKKPGRPKERRSRRELCGKD